MNNTAPQSQAVSFCRACHAPLSSDMSCGAKNDYTFLRCTACETITVDPFPTVAELITFYQAYKGTTNYRAKADKKIHRASRRIKRLTALVKGKRFLDVGSNYGFTVKAALDLGLDARGIDIDAVAVAASTSDYGPHYEVIPVENYAAEGRQADIIYTAEVIEHVPDPDAFVAAMAKILSPGGVLYLTTPDGAHWRLPKTFADWSMAMPPEHITYFSKKGLKALLEKHGLKVEKFFFNWKPGIRVIARKV